MTSEKQRAHWDLKYEQGLTSLTEPDPFFVSAYETFVDQSFPDAGVALDLAGGLGRHALWLASKRWQVTVVDLSDVAIGKLIQTARELNVRVDVTVGDAAEYKFAPTRFDLIVPFYHLDRNLSMTFVSLLYSPETKHLQLNEVGERDRASDRAKDLAGLPGTIAAD